jgi:hypothetical protein
MNRLRRTSAVNARSMGSWTMATRLENPGDGNEGEVDDLSGLSASAKEAAEAQSRPCNPGGTLLSFSFGRWPKWLPPG